MKKFLFLAAALLVSIGFPYCSKDETTTQPVKTDDKERGDNQQDEDEPTNIIPVRIPHYIMGVVETNSYRAFAEDDDPTIHILYDTSGNQKYSFWNETKKPDSKEAKMYASFCERYGDMTYDKERYYSSSDPYVNFYPLYNIVSIRVESIADYDTEHPAGSSLNDLCTLYSATPRKYIADGYVGEFDWSEASDEFGKYSRIFRRDDLEGSIPFAKPLSECTPADLELIGSGFMKLCMLRFERKPAANNSLHVFKITLTDERGKSYMAQTDLCAWR